MGNGPGDDTPDDLLAYLDSHEPAPWSGPSWYYNCEGDQIEVWWSNAMYYGKYVGNGITLMLEEGTDRVVGVTVAGVRRAVEGREGARPMNSTAGIPEVAVPRARLDAEGRTTIPRLLVLLGLAADTSVGRRVVEQGGVRVGPCCALATDPAAMVDVTDGLVVRVGTRKVAQVRLVEGRGEAADD